MVIALRNCTSLALPDFNDFLDVPVFVFDPLKHGTAIFGAKRLSQQANGGFCRRVPPQSGTTI